VHVIAKLYPAARRLGPDSRLTNWRGVQVGELRTTDAFEECRAKLPTQIASS
jgi:hypothetical protein